MDKSHILERPSGVRALYRRPRPTAVTNLERAHSIASLGCLTGSRVRRLAQRPATTRVTRSRSAVGRNGWAAAMN